MKKNGFTFIEMLGVITLLSLIGLIVYMSVDKSLKNSKETLSLTQIDNIKSAAELWKTDHIDMVPENGTYVISLGNLIDDGYIEPVVDAKGNEIYGRNMLISLSISSVDLDSDYIGLKYIQSTGTQYISTDILPTNDMGAKMIVATEDITTESMFFGSKGTDNSRFYFGNVNSRFYFGWNTKTSESSRPYISYDTMYELKLNYLNDRKNVFGNQVVTNSVTTLNTNLFPMAIFASNIEGTIKYKSQMKLYRLVITIGDQIYYDFVPCQRRSDNVLGLYEIYTGKFYTNEGEGYFIKGE